MPSEDEWRTALTLSDATLAPGLTDSELAGVEGRFGFMFPPDLRHLLGLALPLGERAWPDWRSGTYEDLSGRLAQPVDGILFDVEQNAFWHPDWPERPATQAAAVALAREELSSVPPLVPVYANRYLPTEPCEPGNPVLSVHQTDLIYYGNNLLDWFSREFARQQQHGTGGARRVPFWTSLMELDETDSHQFW